MLGCEALSPSNTVGKKGMGWDPPTQNVVLAKVEVSISISGAPNILIRSSEIRHSTPRTSKITLHLMG